MGGNPKNPNFLGNAEYKDFLRVSDCAAALILVSEEGLQKLGKSKSDAVEVIGAEYGAGDLYNDAADMTKMDTTAAVVSRLYQNTGLKIGDIQVAEVHGCFTPAEALMYEAIGLCKHGE